MTNNKEILNKLDDLVITMRAILDKISVEDNQLVNIHMAANMLGKSENAIRTMVHRGQLDCTKLNNGRLAFNKKYLRDYYSTISKF